MSTGGQGHSHLFDSVSGYCQWCGLRNDGRLVDKSGHVYRQAAGYIAPLDDQRITDTIRTMKASST